MQLSITTSQKNKAINEWLNKIGIDSDIVNGYDTVTITFTENDIKKMPANKDKTVEIDINDIKDKVVK